MRGYWPQLLLLFVTLIALAILIILLKDEKLSLDRGGVKNLCEKKKKKKKKLVAVEPACLSTYLLLPSLFACRRLPSLPSRRCLMSLPPAACQACIPIAAEPACLRCRAYIFSLLNHFIEQLFRAVNRPARPGSYCRITYGD
jgi:hypothetical protein